MKNKSKEIKELVKKERELIKEYIKLGMPFWLITEKTVHIRLLLRQLSKKDQEELGEYD